MFLNCRCISRLTEIKWGAEKFVIRTLQLQFWIHSISTPTQQKSKVLCHFETKRHKRPFCEPQNHIFICLNGRIYIFMALLQFESFTGQSQQTQCLNVKITHSNRCTGKVQLPLWCSLLCHFSKLRRRKQHPALACPWGPWRHPHCHTVYLTFNLAGGNRTPLLLCLQR